MNRWKAPLLSLLCAPLLLAGCSFLTEDDPTVNWDAKQLYDAAKDSMHENQISEAMDYFTKIESRYPFTRLAQQAQVEKAYLMFMDGENAQARLACDRFLTQYPNHELSDYVLYLKAMIIVNEPDGMIARLFYQDIAERDAEACRDAFDTLHELVTRFPESRYAPDARRRMHELVLAQARNELNISKYYYVRHAYVASLERAQNILRDYQQTPYVDDALAIMRDCYREMGVTDLERDVEKVIEMNPAPKK